MTEPHGHGHGHQAEMPFPGFRPSGEFAINAQQDALTETRADRDRAVDREVFYKACLAQIKVESSAQISALMQENDRLRMELAAHTERERQQASYEIEDDLANTVTMDPPAAAPEPPADPSRQPGETVQVDPPADIDAYGVQLVRA